MKKYALMFLALLLLSMPVLAQETAGQTTTTTTPKKGVAYQPNVRGSLLLGVGVNVLSNAPEQLDLRTWGSKSVNLYYLYDINIGKSRLSFHPGIGFGFEKYELDQPLILDYQNFAGEEAPVLVLDSLQLVYDQSGLFKKNRIAANYIDIPLEFSWVGNKSNPKSGLKITLGGKVGVLYGSHTKVKYQVGDDNRKEKIKRDWNLNPFRYSAHARIGYSGFNLYFEYQLSELFDPGEGPLYRTRRDNATPAPYLAFPKDVRNLRFGLAIDLF